MLHNPARLLFGLSDRCSADGNPITLASQNGAAIGMCAQIDVDEQTGFCLLCWDQMTRVCDRCADGRFPGCGALTKCLENTHRPSFGS